MQVTQLIGTERFVGTDAAPCQVVEVHVAAAPPDAAVTVGGDAAGLGHADANGAAVIEAALPPEASGEDLRVRVSSRTEDVWADGSVERSEPGWTMHLVSHFHYDPVWWNTQSGFISQWDDLEAARAVRAFDGQSHASYLVDLHLRLTEQDSDYCFVMSEVDYLKPYWDARPERRDQLRSLIATGRLELVGGLYNEPNTNLTSAESTIRNAVYGMGWQREVMGADPKVAWQLDVFGHDPQFPALMADAGLRYSSWARGPFHEWGPMLDTGGSGNFTEPRAMQFESEFDWIAPSGRGVLTSYMPAHYSAGWWMDAAPTLAEAEAAAYRLFIQLKKMSATRHVLLPVGTDHVRPNKWLTRIHRDWNQRYVWPKFVCSLPSRFFAAVDRERTVDPALVSAQTRDMNPVFTGKDVSFIDTKQAQRAAEIRLADAERLATFAALAGVSTYPHDDLDLAWRQLVYGAHHDGITGSESDQVYIDLLGSWREAWTLADKVACRSASALASYVSQSGSPGRDLAVVFNTAAQTRTDVVTLEVDRRPGSVRDGAGNPIPAVAAGDDKTGWTVSFIAADVPGLGYRSWILGSSGTLGSWRADDGTEIENEHHRVRVDPDRGGVVTSALHKVSGRELIASGQVGNELLHYDEYEGHPLYGELGPWHLMPRGAATTRSSDSPAAVRRETSAVGQRLIITGQLGATSCMQTITLWRGLDRIDCVTRLLDFAGRDELVRVRWGCDVPGALPVAEVGNAVIGRPFAHPNSDAAEHFWTLDNPAHRWFALSATATVKLTDPHMGTSTAVPISVAEIISPDREVRERIGRPLATALVSSGVTATNSTTQTVR